MPHHRRRSCLRRLLTAAGVGALLLCAGARTQLNSPRPLADSWSLQQQDRRFAPPPELLLSPEPLPSPAHQRRKASRRKAPRRLLPVRDQSSPQHEEADAVLLPDREVLVLAAEPASAKATCVFQDGASSPARALGRLPGPGRHAYLCILPDSAAQPLRPPMLLSSSLAAAAPTAPAPAAHVGKLLNWNETMVFDSALLPGGDILVFAKGPSHRHGVLRTAAANVQCIYRGGMEASFPAIASAQQQAIRWTSYCG